MRGWPGVEVDGGHGTLGQVSALSPAPKAQPAVLPSAEPGSPLDQPETLTQGCPHTDRRMWDGETRREASKPRTDLLRAGKVVGGERDSGGR